MLPGRLSGYDEDDGYYAGLSGSGTGLTLIIKSLPSFALLAYNDGAKATTILDNTSSYYNASTGEYEIDNFDIDGLMLYIDPTTIVATDFEYAWKDAALQEGVSALYSLTFDGSDESPLPLTLLSFSAKAVEQHYSLLEWKTASETNTKSFIVERSYNAKNFEQIGEVEAAGNSNIILPYAFIDKSCTEELAYYRLKMMDIDGKYAVSKIMAVHFGNETNILVSPNPASNFVVLTYLNEDKSESIDIVICDLNGKTIQEFKNISPNIENRINIENLESGVYLIKVLKRDSIETLRLIKK